MIGDFSFKNISNLKTYPNTLPLSGIESGKGEGVCSYGKLVGVVILS